MLYSFLLRFSWDGEGENVLCSKITNRQLAENNLRTRLIDGLKLIVDNLPLSIDDSLVFRHLLNPDLGVVLFALQLKFNVQAHDLGVLEGLGLLLETRVREGLLESNTVDEKGVLETTTGDLLHTNQLLVEIVLQRKHSIHHH